MLKILLIIFFTLLILWQLLSFEKEGFSDSPTKTPEQKTYSSYGDDISILAHKNAGNIEVLNGKISKLEEMVPEVKKLEENVDQLSKQVRAMASAKMTPVVNAGNKAKPITGL